MKIVFMGTPEFAVPSLRILVKNGFDIAGVITAPDKPAGRGLKLSESAVKKFVQSTGLKILQPTNLKSETFLQELQSLGADLQVVVAFRMLPEAVWDMPPLGSFNLHASLLPDYRGAAPINWAIINGEKETGVTTFFIEKEIDTGNIIFQERISIGETETAGELHDRMMELGAELVLKTAKAIGKNQEPRIQQKESSCKSAPKLFKENCRINWDRPLEKVYDLIRGLSPFPTAWTTLNGKVFKIFRAEKSSEPADHAPGTFVFNDQLKICAADGYIIPTEVQLEGRKKMSADDFLRGYNSMKI